MLLFSRLHMPVPSMLGLIHHLLDQGQPQQHRKHQHQSPRSQRKRRQLPHPSLRVRYSEVVVVDVAGVVCRQDLELVAVELDGLIGVLAGDGVGELLVLEGHEGFACEVAGAKGEVAGV